MEWTQNGYRITTDKQDLQLAVIHDFLENAYWSQGIPKSVVQKAIEGSVCFGMYRRDEQIGFGRLITDQAVFAYLADIFIVQQYRRNGLGKWLVSCMMSYPAVQGLRRIMLATATAHELYRPFGFVSINQPENLMEINKSDMYRH